MSEIETTQATTGRRLKDLASRLYRGEAGIDVVGKRKIWYTVAGVILLVAIVTVIFRPFNLGIEFEGGNTFTIPASAGTLEEVRAAVEETGVEVATAQLIGGEADSYLIKTPELSADEANRVKTEAGETLGIAPESISDSAVSGAWGAAVTTQAAIGAGVFLVLVVIYLSLVFREWKMAIAALAALFQNLILTVAVYLLVGFEVTPSTVIGFLTILGFALYDVVVVFDKVRENTRGITGNPNRTYGEAANLAVNQTLMRSINTAIVALLPVGGLLFIGAGLMGAGTLKDLGLVLFIGMLAAVYSSIFFATPVLVDLKEAEPRFALHKQRVLARRSAPPAERKAAAKAPAKAAVKTTAAGAKAEVPLGDPIQTIEVEPSLGSGAAPRPGARPAPRKRQGTGGKRPGGARKR